MRCEEGSIQPLLWMLALAGSKAPMWSQADEGFSLPSKTLLRFPFSERTRKVERHMPPSGISFTDIWVLSILPEDSATPRLNLQNLRSVAKSCKSRDVSIGFQVCRKGVVIATVAGVVTLSLTLVALVDFDFKKLREPTANWV
jgi:hypothetical protein